MAPMDDSIFDLVSRFKDEQRALGTEVKSITIGSESILLNSLPMAPTENTNPAPFGIPMHVDPHMPKNCGMIKTPCRHSFYEQQADGGEVMHMAKQHTVILKFGE